LEQEGFKISWDGDMRGRAKKGGKFWNLIAGTGGTATYSVVDFEISGSTESWNLRLIKDFEGRNLLDRRAVDKKFEQFIESLAGIFRGQGLLSEVVKS